MFKNCKGHLQRKYTKIIQYCDAHQIPSHRVVPVCAVSNSICTYFSNSFPWNVSEAALLPLVDSKQHDELNK